MGIVTTIVAPRSAATEIESVYVEESPRLWRALCAYASNEDVASEAVAEAFARALRNRGTVRDVRAWVWRTAFRIASHELRRRSHLTYEGPPEQAIEESPLDPALQHALDQLTPPQRMVIVLYYWLDLPVREISHRTGMNQVAVRAHLSRGRRRMRSYLGEDR